MKWTVLLFAGMALCQAQQYSTGQAARLVIGQKPFSDDNPGSNAWVLGSVGGVAYANNTLVVADANRVGGTPVNHRVLIYNNVDQFVLDRKAAFPQSDLRCPACVGRADVVLGQASFESSELQSVSDSTLRSPVGVAYNGRVLAVADTDNNRVLIWKSLPTMNKQKADLVVGQKNFTAVVPGSAADQLRGPEAVWLDANDGLWVADTNNSRVLFYGPITANGQSAKLALGQPDVNGNQQVGKFPDYIMSASSMVNPTSVTIEGTHVFVADLGLNRVLIWNTIPSKSGQAADVVIGQPDMTTGTANYTSKLCPSNGTDSDGELTYPDRCSTTLELPRYALSDGTRLYVADGGNDRILIYNQVPTANAAAADLVLGQQDMELNMASDSAAPTRVSSSDSFRTPTALAWDGTNLYASDVYNRRVVVYTPADFPLPITAVRNAASPEVHAKGAIVFSGTVDDDVLTKITITIGNNDVLDSDGEVVDGKDYVYTTVAGDSFSSIIDQFVTLINADSGDQYVTASPNKTINAIILTARVEGVPGNSISLATALKPTTSTITATVSAATLSGGQDASFIAPYAIVTVLGDNLADETTSVADLTQPLPKELGGVQFFVDGIQAPVIAASPTRVLAQIPLEVHDGTSSSGILRVRRADGSITVSTPVAIPIIAQNPAVFANPTLDPQPGFAYHSSSQATGTVSVDGTAHPGDVVSVKIRDRAYSYTVQTGDTLPLIRDALIELVNAFDPEVEAVAAGPFQRIRLRSLVPGPVGNGIAFSVSVSTGAEVIMTAFNSELCCANEAGAPLTEDNPAEPGETIVVLAGGLGMVGPREARDAMTTGRPYFGPVVNDVTEFVSSLAGGKTANVVFSGLRQGAVGIYEVYLELNSDLVTNPLTQVTIAQSYQVSNIFTIPVVNKKPTS